MFGSAYSVREKYFYALLRELWLHRKSEDDWLLFNDSQEDRRPAGFRSYGLSSRICKSARQKLKRDGLLECRYVHGAKGYRIGTEYRLLDERFTTNPKATHTAIIGRLGEGVMHLPAVSQ